MTAAIVGLRSLSFIPALGEHALSVNLALVDPSLVWDTAKLLGFKPELVQITSRFGTEIHALLFLEQLDGKPLNWTTLDDQTERLAEQIDPIAIRHVYSGRLLAQSS